MADLQTSNAIPQGFSVYQPAPGAQLQFLPPMGTQQLDDLISACIPGPASLQEKRAAISIDFLKYTQTSAASFKFYQVSFPVASPAMTDSLPFTPATPSWDFSNLPMQSVSTPSASSSRSSQSRQNSVAASSVSRHQTADFAHLPGMKILTRDGTDVTNSAFRNVKTKEQRDHAHLMRIIKACDSCRKRKTRCDPSHRKSGGAATPAKAQAAPGKVVKRTTKAAQVTAPKPQTVAQPSIFNDDFAVSLTQPAADMSFADNLDDFSMANLSDSEWDQLLAPSLDFTGDFQLGHGFSPSDFSLSPQSLSATANSSSSASPSSLTPASSSDSSSQLPQTPQLPYVGHSESGILNDYMDFSLYSPQSSFSEDEHMLPLKSTSTSASGSSSSSWSSIQPSGDSSGLQQATSQAVNSGVESLTDAFNLDNFVFATAAPATAVAGGLAQANESSVLPYTTELAPDRYDPGSAQLEREDAGGFLQGIWHTDGPTHRNRLPIYGVPGGDVAHNQTLLAAGTGASQGPSNADLIRAYEAMVSSIGFHDEPAENVQSQATGAQPFAERTQRIARPLPTDATDKDQHSQVANATLLAVGEDSTIASPTQATVTLSEATAKNGTIRPAVASSDDLQETQQDRLCPGTPASEIGSDGDRQSSPADESDRFAVATGVADQSRTSVVAIRPTDESSTSAVATSSAIDAARAVAAFAGMAAVARGETATLQALLTVIAMTAVFVLSGTSLLLRSIPSTTSASTAKTTYSRFAQSRRSLAARCGMPSMTSRLAVCSLA